VVSGAEVDLYDRHPINAEQVLAAVAASGGDPQRPGAADLRPHDQDHYGGVDAVLALATAAGIEDGQTVADICAGIGGPARLIAERWPGVQVLALDLNEGRCRDARRLNRLVGLDGRVCVVRADAQRVPLSPSGIDVAISQEAMLHIPDKLAVMRSILAALKPGGRFAFTDLVAAPALTESEREAIATGGMQMVNIQSTAQYRKMAVAAGFEVVQVDDLSADWVGILTERMEMYRSLRQATLDVHGGDAHDRYMAGYEVFVGLVRAGHLGGARIVLRRPLD
jgi:SAM-dependent methyltransferase